MRQKKVEKEEAGMATTATSAVVVFISPGWSIYKKLFGMSCCF